MYRLLLPYCKRLTVEKLFEIIPDLDERQMEGDLKRPPRDTESFF